MHLRRRLNASASRPKWATPVAAVVTASAVATAAVFGGNQIVPTQNAGGNPVDATVNTASFSTGKPTVVDDPAISTQGDGDEPRAVQEFTQDEEFDSFALTWQGEREIFAHFRAQRPDGSWGPWYEADPLPNPAEATRQGTELIYVEPTNRVQVSVANLDLYTGEGAAPAPAAPNADADADAPDAGQPAPAEAPAQDPAPAEAPAQAPAPQAPAQAPAQGTAGLQTTAGLIEPVVDEVDLTDTAPAVPDAAASSDDFEAIFVNGHAEQSSGADEIAPTADASIGIPGIVSRAAWGANESLTGNCSRSGMDYKALTLHHTAGSNNYTPAQAKGQMRGVYKYHASTLGWCDVGYHALVDKYGTIYEGRRGGLVNGIQGAHAGGYNNDTFGISMMGNYDQARVSQETIQSVGQIAGWRAAHSGFDPSGSVSLTSQGGQYPRYPRGDTRQFPRFHGHRDLGNTSCPGGNAVTRWSEFRAAAKEKYQTVTRQMNGQSVSPGGTNNQNNESTPTRPNNPGNNPGDTPVSRPDGGLDEPAQQLLAALGLIAPLVMAALQYSDSDVSAPGDANALNEIELSAGVTLGDLPGFITQVVSLSGDSEIEQNWARINTVLGPILGTPISGRAQAGNGVEFALFENGVIFDSEETGTNALWGEIAKAWAGGAFAELGLPTSEEYNAGQKIRVNFQEGYATYDPETGKVDVFTD